MAHFSAFFTAIFLLICALLIEQFAMAQSYDQLLGNNNNNDEPDYEYRRSPANRASSSSRNNRLSQDQEEAGEGDDMDDTNEAPPPPPGDGFGDIENEEENDSDGDGGTGGDRFRDDGDDDEENMDGGDGESSEDQGMLDSDEEEDRRVQRLPTYSQYQHGGSRHKSRAHGQGYRLPGGYDISSGRTFNQLNSPYVDSHKMSTLPEKNEEYDEDDDDGGGSRGDYDTDDKTADSPSNHHYEKESLLEAPNDDYNYSDDKYSQNERKVPDTLVT